jgi:hypothetical protein
VWGPYGLIKLGPYQTRHLRAIRCEQEPTAERFEVSSTDLGTGRGTVTVKTEHFTIVWDEALGGTIRSFVLPSGRDYGAGSFGVEYRLRNGFVQQTSHPPWKMKVSRDGFCAVVNCSWRDDRIGIEQYWIVRASYPCVELKVMVSPFALRGGSLTLLNTNFRRNDLGRIYPGFTTLGEASGWTPDRKELHFGWKECWEPYVPDAWVAYSPDANNVQEAIAIIPRFSGPISGFRQGFYPQRPPGTPPAVDSRLAAPAAPSYQAIPSYPPGTADRCEIEIFTLPRGGTPAEAAFIIYPFSGPWDAFKDFIQLLQNPPLVSTVESSLQ